MAQVRYLLPACPLNQNINNNDVQQIKFKSSHSFLGIVYLLINSKDYLGLL